MSTLKLLAALTVTSGILAAGVVRIIPRQEPSPREDPVAAVVTPPVSPPQSPDDGGAVDSAKSREVPTVGRTETWTAPATPVAPQPVPAEPAWHADPAPPSPPVRSATLVPPPASSPAPVQTWQSVPQPELREKAESMLDKGDVASARLWLQLAADKGDADAVFRLAESYDPAMLREWKVMGLTSDVALARTLYAKALTGGVEEARSRLSRLGR